MDCNQAFEVHVGDEDAATEYDDVVDNMLSLSQGHCQPLGDNDEQISATQYDNEASEDVMEVVQSIHEICTNSKNQDHGGIVDPHVVEGFQTLQRHAEELTLPSRVE